MKAKILDSRAENSSRCYLCSITLEDYITSLPDTYRDYPIQRQIVKNVYLDDLIKTVLRKKHIPPIVLVIEDGDYKLSGQSLEINNFKILDGLQRTHRLKVIFDTALFYVEEFQTEKEALTDTDRFSLSRKYSHRLRQMESSSDLLFTLMDYAERHSVKGMMDSFRNNYQWFEIWAGLTPEEEVQKMLVLNAGHKAVNIRHQLELLFLNILPYLQKDKYHELTLVRERDQSATTYSKRRRIGQFHFAHLIAALLSYIEGQPITTNTSLIQNIQNTLVDTEHRQEVFDFSLLDYFVSFLLEVDVMLADQYGSGGTQWLGREVALAGLCGALGSLERNNVKERKSGRALERFLSLLNKHPGILNLNDFEKERNTLDLSKVNIGAVNKSSVYDAIKDLMSSAVPQRIDWNDYFRRYLKA